MQQSVAQGAQQSWVWPVLLGAVAAAELAITPWMAGMSFRAFTCELVPEAGLLWVSFANPKHLVGYSILAFVCAMALRGRPLWMAAGLAFAVTLGVEIEQSLFDDGHCRVRDLLPNLVAVSLGAAAAWGWMSFERGKRSLQDGH